MKRTTVSQALARRSGGTRWYRCTLARPSSRRHMECATQLCAIAAESTAGKECTAQADIHAAMQAPE